MTADEGEECQGKTQVENEGYLRHTRNDGLMRDGGT